MNPQKRNRNRLFLFNTIHENFVHGDDKHFPSAVTRKKAVRQYVFLMFVIALPMVLTITLLIAVAGFNIQLLLIVELVTALIICAYFVLRQYLRDRVLRYDGIIIYGEIVRQEMLPIYGSMGTSTVTRIFYRFATPDNERKIDSVDLSNITHRMPDGRKYPSAGTPIAVLYANDNNHRLL